MINRLRGKLARGEQKIKTKKRRGEKNGIIVRVEEHKNRRRGDNKIEREEALFREGWLIVKTLFL
jgi:hypothetical protein